jgi:hypothetical protein
VDPSGAVIRTNGASLAPLPVPDSAGLLGVIERAATNPAVDIDKMERLMEMLRRLRAEQAETAFNAALTEAQAELEPVSRDATNPQTKSKYSTYAALNAAAKPIYTKHGFALSFDEEDSPKPDHIRVIGLLSHRAGHTRRYHTDMPSTNTGAKGNAIGGMNPTQAVGSAKQYGRRYILTNAFDIATTEHDDDGNAASTAGPAKDAEGFEICPAGKQWKGKRWADVDWGFVQWASRQEGPLKEGADREIARRGKLESSEPAPRRDPPAQAPVQQPEPLPLAAQQLIPGDRQGRRWGDPSDRLLAVMAKPDSAYSQPVRDGARAEIARRAGKAAPATPAPSDEAGDAS